MHSRHNHDTQATHKRPLREASATPRPHPSDQPPGIRHQELGHSDDVELLEIVMPGDFSTEVVDSGVGDAGVMLQVPADRYLANANPQVAIISPYMRQSNVLLLDSRRLASAATPEDLKGLKIRVVGSPLFLDTFTALGANPTQMSWADAQPAFASGAVDGQENPLSIFTAAKLHSVAQKHITLWGYVNDPLIFVVNKEIWNSWTPADREIVKQAAIDAGKEEIALARAWSKPTNLCSKTSPHWA